MERAYIDTVNNAYDEFFLKEETQPSVLVIDSDTLDFVHNEEDLHLIETSIRQKLHLPPFQPELPINQ